MILMMFSIMMMSLIRKTLTERRGINVTKVKMSPQLASTDLRVSEVAEMWSIVDRLVDTEDFLSNYIEYSDDPQELNTEHNRLFNFVQKIRARQLLETDEF